MTISDKHTLLYVDDEPINRQLFAISFKKKFKVLTADSGNEGLGILENNSDVTIVISDMKMPEMNGIEFIQRARDKYQNIAFFILTGFDIDDEISKALKNGLIYKYFRKPFNIKEIESSICSALKTMNNS